MKNNTMKFFLFAALLSLVTALPSHFATKPGTVSAKALKMPGVKALEFLRGADPVMLKHCTDPDSLEECPDDILLQLELLGQHEGIAMLGDIMLVDFCARSPFADSLDICKERDAKIMLTHLHKYQDKEYRNKEMLVPIQYVMKFLCHNADFKSELAVCAEGSGLVQWKPPKKLPASAKNLPGVQAFQALRRTDVVELAHCAADV